MTLKTIVQSFIFAVFLFLPNATNAAFIANDDILNLDRAFFLNANRVALNVMESVNNASVRESISVSLGEILLTNLVNHTFKIPVAFYAGICGVHDSYKCRESSLFRDPRERNKQMKGCAIKALAYGLAGYSLLIEGVSDAKCGYSSFGPLLLLIAGIIDNTYG